ncbi:MAG: hypothetical protein NVS3B21_09410 [Acidimicrobiales bacterium]
MHHLLLASVTWENQLRGALIIVVAALVLPGSVYLLLATNTGAKLGFLLAVAGLSGWMLALNIIWLGYGIGYKGAQPTWVVKEIAQGDLVSRSAIGAVVGKPGDAKTAFPNGWKYLPPGNSILAPASPVADKALIPPAPGTAAASAFPPPFKSTQDYVPVSGWTKGGHNYLVNLFGYKVYWRIKHHPIYLVHQPHYLVIRVQPSLPSITLAGSAATLPAADATQPLTSVVMLRDVGSLRLPPIILGFASFIVFAMTCERLHSRDKAIARRKEEDAAGPATPARGRTAGELQPA